MPKDQLTFSFPFLFSQILWLRFFFSSTRPVNILLAVKLYNLDKYAE